MSTPDASAEAPVLRTLAALRLGFQVIGFDWRYIYINPAAAAHGQRTVKQLTGQTMMAAYPGIEETEMFARLRRCMQERTADTFDNEFTYPDGSSRWFEVRVEPVPEGICVYSYDTQHRAR